MHNWSSEDWLGTRNMEELSAGENQDGVNDLKKYDCILQFYATSNQKRMRLYRFYCGELKY